MSADRSIEGDGKLNPNVYDVHPRCHVSNINDTRCDTLTYFCRDMQEVSNAIKYIKYIKFREKIRVFSKFIHSRAF